MLISSCLHVLTVVQEFVLDGRSASPYGPITPTTRWAQILDRFSFLSGVWRMEDRSRRSAAAR